MTDGRTSTRSIRREQPVTWSHVIHTHSKINNTDTKRHKEKENWSLGHDLNRIVQEHTLMEATMVC